MTTPPHGYTVDLALLDQTTERIAQYVRSLTDTMAGIDADVTQRCAAVWGGEGSAAYQERQARWNAAIARANGEVEEMRLAARIAHGNYSSARSTNISMLGR
ncbi:WXG100 family type VII secretion target [Rhodococcus sp. P1Y]|uniref:WXG100 family type VII secretion target n=1 Tax=Rhodococcus sp. P1Y TaxID=1302308 RepID=UPI001379C1C2|nr:WXG100 family type VII secretion target [Rhodococcus sp. P1Y]